MLVKRKEKGKKELVGLKFTHESSLIVYRISRQITPVEYEIAWENEGFKNTTSYTEESIRSFFKKSSWKTVS